MTNPVEPSADTLIEEVMNMSDDEIRQVFIDEGEDPDEVAEQTKRGIARVLETHKLKVELRILTERLELYRGDRFDPDEARKRLIERCEEQRDEMATLTTKLSEAEAELIKHRWHRVQFFTPQGCVPKAEAEYPIDGRWILIEIESATGIKYQASISDRRGWNSFGVRWRYCAPPDQAEEK